MPRLPDTIQIYILSRMGFRRYCERSVPGLSVWGQLSTEPGAGSASIHRAASAMAEYIISLQDRH